MKKILHSGEKDATRKGIFRDGGGETSWKLEHMIITAKDSKKGFNENVRRLQKVEQKGKTIES